MPAAEVLSGRRAEFELLDEELLGTLLFLAAGVTRVARTTDGVSIWFRITMSAGNMHPVEVYVVDDDVHHTTPSTTPWTVRPAVNMCEDVPLVLRGNPFRTGWKYGERGWRHRWWDAGAMLANLSAAADAHGVPVEVPQGFPTQPWPL